MRFASACVLLLLAQPALAQDGDQTSIWTLFRQSFDMFSVLLIVGSLAAVALMFRAMIDIRAEKICPKATVKRLAELIRSERWSDLKRVADADDTFPAIVVVAALVNARRGSDAAHEAAELAASEQCARWFRRIEPLNVIGNLGPLVGLAGTVWGMILAFTSLGQAGGQAGPADLSLGISKALFHTLLGLLLAIPCLLVFGFYRSVVDRICNRAMAASAELVDAIDTRKVKL